jgi:N-acetylglucosaminyl-diphospho-decaprenol L-rhamnosyltransferase
MDISIIIINYHSVTFTKACLKSIYENNDALRVEVIVIDNASYDGCGDMVRAEFSQVTFIQSASNLGFAGANNLGIQVSHGTHLLFLNPDTEIEGKAIERLLRSLASIPDAGMVGARLLNSDLSVQTTSITAFPTITNQVLGTDYLRQRFPDAALWGIKPLFENRRTPVAVDAISGACMMAKREAIEQVRGFTADYFMYAEDVDLCLKMKKAGWKVYYVPDAVIVHHGGRSSDSRPELNYAGIMIRESMYHFMQVHRGRLYAWSFRAAIALVALCRIVLLTVLLPASMFSARGHTVIPIWRKWAGILAWCVAARFWAQRERSIPRTISPPVSPSEGRCVRNGVLGSP